MDLLSQSLRHSSRPRLVLGRLHRAPPPPQTRLYTKESLDRRRRRVPANGLSTRIEDKAILPPSMPGGPPRGKAKVEAFGKPRDVSSNAAKAERFKESRRLEKALRHEHHGENVYAYAHIGTGQVVYSLTRVMDNNNILRQLVFHGKKTVPASLRRDLWTPYFSLHFPSSYSGLLAYHHLRELSLQRQLQPPDYLTMTTIQTASKEQRKKMSKEEEDTWDEEREGQEYPDGRARMASRRDRAKTLMYQKATSVADVAFVVGLLHTEGHLRTPASVEELMRERREERLKEASKRRTKKLRAGWRQEEATEQKYKDLTRRVQEGTKWGLEMYAARRISMEHGGLVIDPRMGRARVLLPGREGDARMSEDFKGQQVDTLAVATTALTPPPPPSQPLEVRIFWSDLRDATYAAKWPQIVSHGELERMAHSRRAAPHGTHLSVFVDRSVHVIGGMKMGDDSWMRGMRSTSNEGSRDGEGEGEQREQGGEGKSRQEQTLELEREGVVVEPPRRKGLIGWVKGSLGLPA